VGVRKKYLSLELVVLTTQLDSSLVSRRVLNLPLCHQGPKDRISSISAEGGYGAPPVEVPGCQPCVDAVWVSELGSCGRPDVCGRRSRDRVVFKSPSAASAESRLSVTACVMLPLTVLVPWLSISPCQSTVGYSWLVELWVEPGIENVQI